MFKAKSYWRQTKGFKKNVEDYSAYIFFSPSRQRLASELLKALTRSLYRLGALWLLEDPNVSEGSTLYTQNLCYLDNISKSVTGRLTSKTFFLCILFTTPKRNSTLPPFLQKVYLVMKTIEIVFIFILIIDHIFNSDILNKAVAKTRTLV